MIFLSEVFLTLCGRGCICIPENTALAKHMQFSKYSLVACGNDSNRSYLARKKKLSKKYVFIVTKSYFEKTNRTFFCYKNKIKFLEKPNAKLKFSKFSNPYKIFWTHYLHFMIVGYFTRRGTRARRRGTCVRRRRSAEG